MFTKKFAPSGRATTASTPPVRHPSRPEVQQALAVLAQHYQQVQPRQRAVTASRPPQPNPWARVEHTVVYLVDPGLAPVAVPLRRKPGFFTLHSGRPAIRFVAEGFINQGSEICAYVCPDDATGAPRVVHAEGAPKSSFKAQG